MVDVNGPKKGLGQVCRVFVEFTHGGGRQRVGGKPLAALGTADDQ